MDYSNQTDDQLAFHVAVARGCRPAVSANNTPYCPCQGMPHGMSMPTGIQGTYIGARLHKFPRDVALAVLKAREPKEKEPEGTTVCKFLVDLQGKIRMNVVTPGELQNYTFMVLMRGAAMEMDDHYSWECQRLGGGSKRLEKDIDDMLGGDDGVGAPGS